MTPTSLPLPSTTPRQPSDFCVMVTSAALIATSSPASGRRSPVCMTSATNLSCAPSEPPGWITLKSCAVKPLLSSSAIARQSPMASCMVVEVVGARPCGQASLTLRQLQHHIGLLAERRLGARGDGHQRHLEAARVGDDVADLHASRPTTRWRRSRRPWRSCRDRRGSPRSDARRTPACRSRRRWPRASVRYDRSCRCRSRSRGLWRRTAIRPPRRTPGRAAGPAPPATRSGPRFPAPGCAPPTARRSPHRGARRAAFPSPQLFACRLELA